MPFNPPVAAKPTKSIFDAWNSSSTGHQRADSKLAGSTHWRDSRNSKLRQQYVSGAGGGKRVSDTVGAGSEEFGQDGRLENGAWARGASGLRTGGQRSIWESMKVDKNVERPAKKLKLEETDDKKPTSVVNPFTPFRKPDGTIRETSWTSHETRQDFYIEAVEMKQDVSGKLDVQALKEDHSKDERTFCIEPVALKQSASKVGPGVRHVKASSVKHNADSKVSTCEDLPPPSAQPHSSQPTLAESDDPTPQIFAGLTVYVNGSTAPLISDHRLKFLLSTHGANMSISLGRKTVTHVILGRTTGTSACGGGLASSKIQKEVSRIGGKPVKFVTADWIVESIKAGKRLNESRFQGVRLASKGVDSIANVFSRNGNVNRQASGND